MALRCGEVMLWSEEAQSRLPAQCTRLAAEMTNMGVPTR